jgi:UDP-glucose 4-epimerase
LVVGGSGYIGSHMVKMFSLADHDVMTLDNLSNGYKDAVKYGDFVEGNITDSALLNKLFSEN